MIACPICQTQNHHLAVACRSCGSFLQPKVETLDLFSTLWRLVDSPEKAFHRIAMAAHKNYIIVLGALSGIAFMLAMFWVLNIGNTPIPLLNILAAGLIAGPFIGIVNLLLLGFIQAIVALTVGLKAKYRNSLAVIAYACVPVVLLVIFVLPIKILTYGKYLFSTNPSPWTLKPVSYTLLLVLDGVLCLWSLFLYAVGVKVLYDIPLAKALVVSNGTLVVFAAIVTCIVLLIASAPIEHTVEKYFAILVPVDGV